MHPLYEKADAVSKDVYLAALEVRRVVGSGTMLEKVYQKCLQHELQMMGHKAEMEQPVKICYKDKVWEENLRIDILVDDCLVVECKAIEGDKVDMEKFKAQTLTYLKLTNLPLGMVINFGSDGFGKRGIHRVILKGASVPDGQERKVIPNPIVPPAEGGREAHRDSESLFLRAPSGACVPSI